MTFCRYSPHMHFWDYRVNHSHPLFKQWSPCPTALNLPGKLPNSLNDANRTQNKEFKDNKNVQFCQTSTIIIIFLYSSKRGQNQRVMCEIISIKRVHWAGHQQFLKWKLLMFCYSKGVPDLFYQHRTLRFQCASQPGKWKSSVTPVFCSKTIYMLHEDLRYIFVF